MVDNLQGRSPSSDLVGRRGATAAAASPLSGPLSGLPARRSAGAVPARPRSAGWWWWVAAVAAVASGVSLLFTRTPTFDPLTWAIWGRELAHGELVTAGDGAAFKPLPVFVDALVARLGGDPTVVWVGVTRAAGLLALALAARVALRFAGSLGRTAAVVAAVVAAAALALSPDMWWFAGSGMAEPIEMCALLAAVLSWAGGRRGATVAWLTVLSLLRPEAWPLLAVAGLATAWPSPRRLAGRVLLGVLVLAAWFAPEYAGSGNLFRSAERAGVVTNGGTALASVPGLALIRSVGDVLLTPLVLLAVAAGAWYCVRALRGDRSAGGAVVGVAVGVTWVLILAAMVQTHHSTGTLRYLAAVTALTAVFAGCGFAWLVAAVRGAPRRTGWLATAAVIAAVAWSAAEVGPAVGAAHEDLRAVGAADTSATALRAIVAAAGGREALNACGPVATGPYEVPVVSWTLRRHLLTIGYEDVRTGTVVQMGSDPVRGVDLVRSPALARHPWVLRSSCPAVAAAAGGRR